MIWSWEGQLWKRALTCYAGGDMAGAAAAQQQVLDIRSKIVGMSPPSDTANYTLMAWKAFGRAIGYDVGPCRLPLSNFSQATAAAVASAALPVLGTDLSALVAPRL